MYREKAVEKSSTWPTNFVKPTAPLDEYYIDLINLYTLLCVHTAHVTKYVWMILSQQYKIYQ